MFVFSQRTIDDDDSDTDDDDHDDGDDDDDDHDDGDAVGPMLSMVRLRMKETMSVQACKSELGNLTRFKPTYEPRN